MASSDSDGDTKLRTIVKSTVSIQSRLVVKKSRNASPLPKSRSTRGEKGKEREREKESDSSEPDFDRLLVQHVEDQLKRQRRELERDKDEEKDDEKRGERKEEKRRDHNREGEKNEDRRRMDERRDRERARQSDREGTDTRYRAEERRDGRRMRGDGDRRREEEDRGDRRNELKRKVGEEVQEEKATGRGADVGTADPIADEDYLKAKRAKVGDEMITTKTGGAYIPPARLRAMQAKITDRGSVQYQRVAWEALKKSINGLINKVNVLNIEMIVRELFQENIVRGRGLLARSIITAQGASPTFTHVYAALVAIINTKFPNIGELILRRLILQFRKNFKRNNKQACMTAAQFIGHLVNQQVAHEILALEILTLLLENPTDDSVEIAIAFLKEVGMKLTEISPRGINAIFERLRNVLQEAEIDKRVQYMIEVMFAIRKDGFKDHPALISELDKVEEDDQFTHALTLDDEVNGEEMLNVFKHDPQYEETEEKYKEVKREILDEGSSDEDGKDAGSGSESSDEEDEEGKGTQVIIDNTETNLVALRRTIYLTIQSSLDFEECAHKLLKMQLKPGQEVELCSMILDCCAQQRTYEKFFGLLAQRFCMLNKMYIDPFEKQFAEQYETIHRLEINKLRNIAKLFGHLLHTDAISWEVLKCIKLNEEDTTSSGRIFIKYLFQELSEYLGLSKLNDRLNDSTLSVYFEGIFPRDNPRNTRFSINFFTSIGLGGLTDQLRAHLKTMPKPAPTVAIAQPIADANNESDSSEDDSDDNDDDSSVASDSPKRPSGKETIAAKLLRLSGTVADSNSNSLKEVIATKKGGKEQRKTEKDRDDGKKKEEKDKGKNKEREEGRERGKKDDISERLERLLAIEREAGKEREKKRSGKEREEREELAKKEEGRERGRREERREKKGSVQKLTGRKRSGERETRKSDGKEATKTDRDKYDSEKRRDKKYR